MNYDKGSEILGVIVLLAFILGSLFSCEMDSKRSYELEMAKLSCSEVGK